MWKRVLYSAAGVQVQVAHVLLTLIAAGLGGVGAYLSSQSPLSLGVALSSWTTAKPILFGAGGAFFMAIVLQAKQSFLLESKTSGMPRIPYPGDSNPNPQGPTATRRTVARSALAFAALCMTGCASWFQQWQSDPAAAAQQLEVWVNEALQAAATLWSLIAPLLGASASAATEQFNKATIDVERSLVALNAGIDAYIAGKANDLPALETDVKNAVAALETIVNQYATINGADASPLVVKSRTLLKLQTDRIAAWRVR